MFLILAAQTAASAQITATGEGAVLQAQMVRRVIRFAGNNVRTAQFSVAGQEMLAAPAREFSVAIAREKSGRKPLGLRPGEVAETNDFSSANRVRWRSEAFDPARYDDPRPDAPVWADTRIVEAGTWDALAGKPTAEVTSPEPGVARLAIRTDLSRDAHLDGVTIELNYEVYEGFPAVRKWVRLRNHGAHWLRLNRLVIDDLHLAPLTRKPLAAAMFGVQPSVLAFEAPGWSAGLIAASEVPSALRTITDQGAMGYTHGLFEWVLGPGEEFASEPVFYFGYHGAIQRTVSSASTPLDRAVEGPYQEFLHRHIGIAAEHAPMHGPQWMTWAYFYDKIDDARTLTDDNIRHYRRRFNAIRRLENAYGIYRRFQFSGVPEPTDTDWHWWGKLNADGCGVVAVMRGSEGAPRRAVNIPWVRADKQYRVSGVFSGNEYGLFSGRRLQDAGLTVELPPYGQDLLELAVGIGPR